MNDFEILDIIRMRAAMYIGYCSPTHLHSFLSGVYFVEHERGASEIGSDLRGFHDWIAEKLDYSESTSGWAHMIEDQREDRIEGFLLFYELLDEFRGISHQHIAEVRFNHEGTTDRSWRGYSRRKKVRGSFSEVPKPLPAEIIIREMHVRQTWYQMVATNKEKEILFVWHSEDIEAVYKRAVDIFGIQRSEWTEVNEN